MKSFTLFIGIIELLLFNLVAAIPKADFYSFGINHGDNKFPPNDDGSSPIVPISSLFPFFNNQHNSLYVNTNGAISFQRVISQYTPQPFPLNDGRRVIAPFWADVDIRNGGTVWYRESTNTELLRRATQEIQLYYPSQIHFHATWMFIATWDNVAFYGASYLGRQKRNTFQAVLVTNGRHSFTVFNYDNITWTTGTASQGNSNTGLGGTPAQVGFNGGDGINFFVVNQSRTADIINLPQFSNVHEPGKFVFRVDTASIEKGGCNTEGTLTVTPRYIPMFGGKLITVAGPCIDTDETVKISFDYGTTNKCVRRSRFSVQCSTPIFYKTGDVTVHLTVTHADQSVSSYTGLITLLNPIRTTPGLIRLNPQDWKKNNHVKLYLDSEQIPFDVNSASLEVWTVTPKYGEGLPRLEYHRTIEYTQYQQFSILEINFDVTLAVLRLSRTNHEELTQSVWSDVFYIQPATHFMDKQFCKIWQQVDDGLLDISQQNVQDCPCTLDQATVDVVRFQDDPNCNPSADDNRHSIICAFNPEAKQCFRLNVPGPHNTGRLCCYDANGGLMDVRLRNGGGSLHRRFYLGGPGNIPYLSHFVSDVAPYLACCIRGDSDSCQQYLRRRPQGNCENYTPPSFGRIGGDPHFTTLDDLSYTFNGVGEFVLLSYKANKDSFIAQVRMEPVKDENGHSKKASVITSFVAKSHNVSDTVEIQLNTIRVADVLVNGIQIDFTETNTHDFNGLSVSTTSNNASDGSLRQFTVVFKNPSIAFRVLAYSSWLNTFIISSDENLKGKMAGLLGNYNGDPNDDLLTNNGVYIPVNSSHEIIHREVGLKWRVNVSDSLFTYPRGKNFHSYQNVTFVPLYTFPPVSTEARQICGDDEFCLYDFHTTGDRHIAGSTKAATQTLKVLKKRARKVNACGFTNDTTNGNWNSTGMTINSKAVLVCDNGYKPSIIDQITCMSDGNWTESNDTCKVVDCGTPVNVNHGSWNFTTTTFNSTATLVCHDGFHDTGNKEFYCLDDGQWNVTGAECKKTSMPSNDETTNVSTSGKPGAVENGAWKVTGLGVNSSRSLKCDRGYTTNTTENIHFLSNGSWTGSDAKCSPVDCRKPENITNGSWNFTTTTFDSVTTLVCHDGFHYNGNHRFTCLDNGQWNVTGGAECIETHASSEAVGCRESPEVEHGAWVATRTEYNSTRSLKCDRGYTANKTENIICLSNGSWTESDAKCSIVSCGTPVNVTHGSWNFTTTTFNSTATLVCHDEFHYNGNQRFSCLDNGLWNVNVTEAECINMPSKAVPCGEPANVDHGAWETMGTENNSTRSLICNTGFKPSTTEKIRCLDDGSWTVSGATCSHVDCGIPVNVTYGSWNFTTTTFNSTATLVCHDGFYNSGNDKFSCLDDGQWNVTGDECIKNSKLSKETGQKSNTVVEGKLNIPLIAGAVVACVVATLLVSWLVYKRRSKRFSATRFH